MVECIKVDILVCTCVFRLHWEGILPGKGGADSGRDETGQPQPNVW